MSNPGVITLAETFLATRKNFRVEDNLAESIHFHYRDIRIDLTIRELEKISKICDYSIHDLVKVDDFDLDLYDDDFLMHHAADFIDLVQIEKKMVPVSELYFPSKGLCGCLRYKKMSRRFAQLILARGKQDAVPVIYNDGKVLLSGTYAVAQCYMDNPSAQICVHRFVFDDNKHSLPRHPIWNFFFVWDKKKIKRILWKLASKFF